MAVINGTNGADNLVGTTDADTINGLDGNDTINALTRPVGAGPTDYVDGGAGIDTLIVNASAETTAVELFRGGLAFDVRSASGNFFVDSDNMERIQFTGGSGGDTIRTGDAGGTINGNGGVDWWHADLGNVLADITFRLGTTTAIAAAGLTSIVNIERINLVTGSGNDIVDGGARADDIRTGDGDDTIDAKRRPLGAGPTDYVDGGADIDTLIVDASAEAHSVELFRGGLAFDVRSASGNFFVDSDNMEMIQFTGGSAGDTIQTGGAGGTVDGGDGIDWWQADLFAVDDDITFILGTTTQIAAAGLTSILNLERINLLTGAGHDLVHGGVEADDIRTGNGDDTINAKTRPVGAGPTDYVDGGLGIDTLVVDARTETQSVDLFTGGLAFDVRSASGNFFVDSDNMEIIHFTGGNGADIIRTGGAGGRVNGRSGVDWWQADLSGVDDDVTFVLGTTTNITAAGLTSILSIERIDLITGSGHDTLHGGAQGDDFRTGNGNDTVDVKTRSTAVGADTDYVDGGRGIDTLVVNASAETQMVELFTGGLAFDVRSTSGQFFVDSDNMERIQFTGGSAGDIIRTAGAGGTVDGGGGIDWWHADLSHVREAVTFVLGTTTSIAPAGLTSILNLERIKLSTGSGSDTISGGAEADDIRTGSGNDTINAMTRPAAGDTDYVDGGLGIDTLVVNASSETQTVELFSGGAAFDVRSASGNFFLDSDNMEMVNFTGGSGNDAMSGLALADILTGRAGNDVLVGGDGNDTLNGSSGADTITAGRGADALVGGSGVDVFNYDRVQESSVASGKMDSISDFGPGVDVFDLASIDANNSSADGNQAFIFIGAGAFTGVAGELRSTAGQVEADVTGDGVADFRIFLTNGATAAAGDFIL